MTITAAELRMPPSRVPASDKLVSLFEPHADIIGKGARDVQYSTSSTW